MPPKRVPMGSSRATHARAAEPPPGGTEPSYDELGFLLVGSPRDDGKRRAGGEDKHSKAWLQWLAKRRPQRGAIVAPPSGGAETRADKQRLQQQKKLCRSGVPSAMRAEIWQAITEPQRAELVVAARQLPSAVYTALLAEARARSTSESSAGEAGAVGEVRAARTRPFHARTSAITPWCR